MLVNPAKWPQVKAKAGQQLIDWLISPVGQTAINAYQIGGEQLFFANAVK
jgi:tungstate transport system substrate-binding protein